MQFTGTVQIAAPRDAVWAFLMDPNRVGSCGPGVESIEVIDADHFKAKAKVGVGFISARFTVDMTIAERTEPDRALDQGPRPGARGPPWTRQRTWRSSGPTEGRPRRWTWSADVSIAGTLASVGARMIEGTANKMIGQTFDCIRAKLEAG